MDIRNFFKPKPGSAGAKPKKKPPKKPTPQKKKTSENVSPKNIVAEKEQQEAKKKPKPKRKKRLKRKSEPKEEDDGEDHIDEPITRKSSKRQKAEDQETVTPALATKSKKKKRTKKIVLSDDDDDDDDAFEAPPKKSPSKTKSPKRRTPKKKKKTPPPERKLVDPMAFFGGTPSSGKKPAKKAEEVDVEDEELQLAKALSLSEQSSSPITSNYFKKKVGRKDIPYKWQWKQDLSVESSRGWVQYDASIEKEIQKKYVEGAAIVELDNGYSIDFEDMMQFKSSDPTRKRPVQKIPLSSESKSSGKMTTSSKAEAMEEDESSSVLTRTGKSPKRQKKKTQTKKIPAKKTPVKAKESRTVKEDEKQDAKPSVSRLASKPLQDASTTASSKSNAPESATKKRKWYPGMSRAPPPKEGQKEIPEGKPDCLQGLTFVITGVLESLQREDAEDLVKRYGGRVTKAVSGKTSYLLAGTDPGETKVNRAKQKGIKMIDEDELFDLIKSRSPTPSSATKSSKKRKTTPASKRGKQEIVVSKPKDGSGADLLWVDKFMPHTSKELIGNQSHMKKIRDFLLDWKTNIARKTTNKVKNRAVLLAGQAGVGKSTAADVLTRELGFNKIEFNASDVRSKKSLEAQVVSIACNHGIGEYFGSGRKTENKGPTVLVMDEVDGMSGNSDRGGMRLLTQIIKNTKVPIICICNDSSSPKMRTLQNYCLTLKFRRPMASQIAPRMLRILESEGLKVDKNALESVVTATRGDIRQILNLMQMWKKKRDTLSYMDVKKKMGGSGKDFDLGPFDVIEKVFANDFQPGFVLRKSDYFFVDYSLMPLMVEENYLSVNRSPTPLDDPKKSRDLQTLEALMQAAESFSDADVVSTFQRRTQDWSLLPYHAMYSTVIPGSLFAGRMGRPSFPSWLGKFSNRNKNKRFFNLLRVNMSVDSTSNAADIAMYQIPELRTQLLKPMIDDNENGGDKVIETLDRYSLDRNDWEMIMELGDRFDQKLSLKQVPGKVKAAFTRKYNKEGHRLKVARQDIKAVKKKAMKEAKQEAGADDDDDDEETTSSSSLLKKKGRKKAARKSTGRKSTGAKKGTKRKKKK